VEIVAVRTVCPRGLLLWALAYLVCRRIGAAGFEFERRVPAAWMLNHGYFGAWPAFAGRPFILSAQETGRTGEEVIVWHKVINR